MNQPYSIKTIILKETF